MILNIEIDGYVVWERQAEGVVYNVEIEFLKDKYTDAYSLGELLKVKSLNLKNDNPLKLDYQKLEKDILNYLDYDTVLEIFCEEIDDDLFNELELYKSYNPKKFYKNYREPLKAEVNFDLEK